MSQTKKTLLLKLIKSPIGASYKQKANLRGLGLSRINQQVEREDTPSMRGMIFRVKHLITVEESS